MKRFFLANIALFITLFQAYSSKSGSAIPPELMNSLLKYAKVCQLVEQNYVDSVSYDTLCSNAISGMLKKLDPHSSYLTPKQVKASNEVMRNGFDGIGISYTVIDDTLNVIQVIPGGPSEQAGLNVGDKLIYADTVSLAGCNMSNDVIQKNIRGRRGSVLQLTLLRDGKLLKKSVKRGHIPINSVTASYMLTPKIGYIMIERFAEHTTDEFEEALKKLRREGAESLVLDLRGNGGGYLMSAINLLSHFLPAGVPLLKTEGTHRQLSVRFSRPGYQKFTNGALIVLIDSHSASASEITAGAIQDLDRGVIVGCRSYGKGLVQQPYQLADSSEVRITIARYCTPSGRSIQKPYKNGEYLKTDTIANADSLKYSTLMSGRTVYGGGGVCPDVYIAPDTTKLTSFQKAVLKKQVLVKTSLDYYVKNKTILEEFEDCKSLYDSLKIEPVIKGMEQSLLGVGIDYSSDEMEISKPFFTRYLKALIARCVFGQKAYYETLNIESEEVGTAVSIIEDNDRYRRILGEIENNK